MRELRDGRKEEDEAVGQRASANVIHDPVGPTTMVVWPAGPYPKLRIDRCLAISLYNARASRANELNLILMTMMPNPHDFTTSARDHGVAIHASRAPRRNPTLSRAELRRLIDEMLD